VSAGRESPPYVELQHVAVRFGAVPALCDVNFSVLPGDLLAVIGPDGSGKSTVLRVMVGVQRPSGGRVLRTLPRERLGFSGADFDLYGDLTVEENLAFFGRVRGMSRAQVAETGSRLLELVGLSHAGNRLGAELSGGMKKKLSLAAALLHGPALLLLDEPTVGVDPGSRRELWDIVAQANAWGAAVVFTSSYLDEAERARRVIIMSDGAARETSPEVLLSTATGWRAWLLPLGSQRRELRLRLAQAQLGPRVYLRPEGLAVLARGEEEAWALVGSIVPPGFAGDRRGEESGAEGGKPRLLVPTMLTLEDAFVLTRADHAAVQA
jgi:ABC-2 type transport system ATP-binding protein